MPSLDDTDWYHLIWMAGQVSAVINIEGVAVMREVRQAAIDMSVNQFQRTKQEMRSGVSFASMEQFRFKDLSGLDFNKLQDVIEGKSAGVIFRSAIPAAVCSAVARNFQQHPARYVRGEDAPATYVGCYHYGKDLERYLADANAVDHQLDQLFDGTVDIWSNFTSWMAQGLSRDDIEYRAAEYQGRKASRFVMRTWAGGGNYALLPHEDEAQCSDPRQAGFEIQNIVSNAIVAVNICIDNGSDADLHYWNLMPDGGMRDRLGLTYTGSPYPVEMLDKLMHQKIKINAGDIYCFNGKAIHAVGRPACRERTRSTMSFLMAKRDTKTVIHWT